MNCNKSFHQVPEAVFDSEPLTHQSSDSGFLLLQNVKEKMPPVWTKDIGGIRNGH